MQIEKIKNDNIVVAAYQPEQSELVSIGRKVKILNPPEAVQMVENGTQAIPELLKLLDDKERDFAANAMLYQITNRADAMRVCAYADDVEEWREDMKSAEMNYWKKWAETNLPE